MPDSGKMRARSAPAPNLPPVREIAVDDDEPPGSPRRHDHWKDVPQDKWEDWKWQLQNAVRTTAQLAELLPFTAREREVLERLESLYKTVIPPYYFSLIHTEDPADPIRLQSVPSPLEMTPSTVELEDPLDEESDSPVPGLTHRYPDRALVLTTPACSMYCRFCTRKRVTLDRGGWDGPSHDEVRIMDYLRAHREVRDVIVSGGDPLMLPPKKLKWFLDELAAMKHVDVIRIGTRVPVTLPQKLFDPDLIALLSSAGKVWIQTHFNHPSEITPEAARGCRNLINAGIPINNHSVLLKGVNDSVATMRTLLRGLLRIKVRPYYLFHCDPVTGAGHFRTSVWKGLEIMEGLRGHMSGLAVPTYVVDGLHGAGKIPLMPNYLVSAGENTVILRNYEGLLFRYNPEDQGGVRPEGLATLGVSNLLSGNGQVLVPEGNRRYAKRRTNRRKPKGPVPAPHLPVAVAPAAAQESAVQGNSAGVPVLDGTVLSGTIQGGASLPIVSAIVHGSVGGGVVAAPAPEIAPPVTSGVPQRGLPLPDLHRRRSFS